MTKIRLNIPGNTILISPLDWGLGHATRCIPIIASLIEQNKKVIVAAEGAGMNIIKEAFPNVTFLPLKGYRITYSKKGHWFFIKLMAQLPKILTSVIREKKWVQQAIRQHNIDTIISDNRLGFYSKEVHSVFITHQLGIKTGSSFLDKVVQKINYFFINQFDECWIPDYKGNDNLAGELSHPTVMPKIPTVYIGLLSRFQKKEVSKRYKWAVVLSGPEPQRTIFENIITKQIKNSKDAIVLVRGLPENSAVSTINLGENISVYNHLEKDLLSEIMQQSNVVIARSGYSTIMDLMAIAQRAVLVPTPGQTEQEYLAKYLSEKKTFRTVSQSNFDFTMLPNE